MRCTVENIGRQANPRVSGQSQPSYRMGRGVVKEGRVIGCPKRVDIAAIGSVQKVPPVITIF